MTAARLRVCQTNTSRRVQDEITGRRCVAVASALGSETP